MSQFQQRLYQSASTIEKLLGLTRADFINHRLEVNQFRIDPRPGAVSGDTALSIGAGSLLSESDLMVITRGHL